MGVEQRVFITGGASGLGRSLAEGYAKAGARVLIGDIREDRAAETLARLKAMGATAEFIGCDVTESADLEAAATWLERNWGGVDIVYNNAGVVVSGAIDEVPIDDWEWIVDVNLLGVVRGSRVFSKLMKRQGKGHIVNVASLAGLVHPPLMAPYNAVKSAVVALSETLFAELKRDGIAVSVVCPSFFRTNLIETARCSDSKTLSRAQTFVGKAPRSSDYVAGVVMRRVARGDFLILTEAEGRIVWRLKRVLPFHLFAKAFVRWMEKV